MKQAAHGAGLAHVADNFAEGTLLRGGGVKGQDLAMGFANFVGGGEADPGAFAHAAALELEAEFKKEQFFKDKAAMRRG